jgi:hypothetical protein
MPLKQGSTVVVPTGMLMAEPPAAGPMPRLMTWSLNAAERLVVHDSQAQRLPYLPLDVGDRAQHALDLCPRTPSRAWGPT